VKELEGKRKRKAGRTRQTLRDTTTIAIRGIRSGQEMNKRNWRNIIASLNPTSKGKIWTIKK